MTNTNHDLTPIERINQTPRRSPEQWDVIEIDLKKTTKGNASTQNPKRNKNKTMKQQ